MHDYRISWPEGYRLETLRQDHATRYFAWVGFGDRSYVTRTWYIARGGYGTSPGNAIDEAIKLIQVTIRSDLIHWLELADERLAQLQRDRYDKAPGEQSRSPQLDSMEVGTGSRLNLIGYRRG